MDDPILAVFLEEAGERLGELEQDLVRLEQNPADPEIIDRIFRCAHTLKGNSRMLGFEEIAHFTHSLEDLLDKLRKRERVVTPEIVDTLLKSGDVLKALVGVASGQAAPAAEIAEQVLRTIQSLLLAEVVPLAVRGVLAPEPAPAVVAPSASAAVVSDDASFGLFEPLPARAAPQDDTRLVAPAPNAAESPAPLVRAEGARTAPKAVQAESSIRVPVEKVDRLINLVGELVITQSIVAQAVENFTPDKLPALQEAVSQMERHSRELHERMMAVRMVPIRSLFSRFPRLVRDLAGITGKLVVLETEGEDTELDKTVMEHITDPLTHLLRNAIDHGVEKPDERERAGKQRESVVVLSAYQRGGSIYIEVRDDGKGIDCERIKAKAIQNGLISGDVHWTQDQIVQLIFKPGLSTAEKVTEVSGRGVGMDVVKRNIETLGGSISIKTELGKGTLFQIKLPLTLAIMDGQTLKVGDQIFVLPLIAITECVRPPADSLHYPAEAPPLVVIRNRALPVILLHEVFGVEPRFRDPKDGLLVIVECDGQLAGVLVDELLGQQQVVVKNLETHFKRVDGVAGATILGDGRVALILDVSGLIALSRQRPTAVGSAA